MQFTPKVKEILSWYEGENPGVKGNLARLLMHGRLAGSGKLVILPVDQGYEHGPARSFASNPPAYDPHYLYQLALDAGLSGYAAPLGLLEQGADTYAGQLPTILKMNSANSLAAGIPDQAVTASVKDALRLGCVGVGFTIYPGSDQLLRHDGGAARDHPRGQVLRPDRGGLVVPARRQGVQGRRDRARHRRLRGAHGGADGRQHDQGQAAERPDRPGRREEGLRDPGHRPLDAGGADPSRHAVLLRRQAPGGVLGRRGQRHRRVPRRDPPDPGRRRLRLDHRPQQLHPAQGRGARPARRGDQDLPATRREPTGRDDRRGRGRLSAPADRPGEPRSGALRRAAGCRARGRRHRRIRAAAPAPSSAGQDGALARRRLRAICAKPRRRLLAAGPCRVRP